MDSICRLITTLQAHQYPLVIYKSLAVVVVRMLLVAVALVVY
jgi:hypothetical protein